MTAIAVFSKFAHEINNQIAPGFYSPIDYGKLGEIIEQHQKDEISVRGVAETMANQPDVLHYFVTGNIGKDAPHNIHNGLFRMDGALNALKASSWTKALRTIGAFDVLPSKLREEWHEKLNDFNSLPEFNLENASATLLDLLLKRPQFTAMRVEAIFQSLSGEHVTNAPSGFGKRMIVSNCFDSFGFTNYRKAEVINDLRNVIACFSGRNETRHTNTGHLLQLALDKKHRGKWMDLDGGAMRVKAFAVGTIHIEVHEDIAWRLNEILAILYPAAIAAPHRKRPTKIKDRPLFHDLVSPRAQSMMAEMRRLNRDGKLVCELRCNERMNDKAFVEVVECLAAIGGAFDGVSQFHFDYSAEDVIDKLVMSGQRPERKSHQFYPTTSEQLQDLVIDLAEFTGDESCLEPSAGIGHLADKIPSKNVTCVEIAPLHCAALTAKGYRVFCADFLLWAERIKLRYDRIIMNPPFTDRQALDHLKTAAGLLEDDGRLIAIMPATYVNRELFDGYRFEWHGTFAESFDSTSVTVAVVVVTPV